MLKSISFSNFYSFYDETTISFETSLKPSLSYYDVEIGNQRLNKVIAVMGPNGAGKTQLLRPLSFLNWFLTRSFTDLAPEDRIPFEPHALHPQEATAIEVIFYIGETEYKYNIKLNQREVLAESLYVRATKLFSYIFKRERQGDSYEIKKQNLSLSTKLHKNVRNNCSLISAAHIFGTNEIDEVFLFFSKIVTNITDIGRRDYHDGALIEAAEFLAKNPKLLDRSTSILCDLDLGLTKLKISEFENTEKSGEKKVLQVPFGIHQLPNGDTFALPFFNESSGTKSALVLLRKILPVLDSGGIVILDEIDNDLHPHMLPFFLDMIKDRISNPHNAQLIFSCHTPEVLNVLRKHQVYLVEKYDLKSEAWRLDSVEGLRADDNLYAKYQAGVLEAIPNI